MLFQAEITAGLSKVTSPITNVASARDFLSVTAFDKDPTDRLLSYLFVFELLDGPPTAIFSLHSKYQHLICDLFTDPFQPLESLSPSSHHVITVDLHRTLPWLAMAAADLHITLPEDPVPSLHAHRVLAAIDLANRYLVYTQGYDRYVLILYLLTLQFTTQWQLPPEVAESLTFHLTNKVLLLANLPVFLDCSKSTEKKFQLLDNAVHKRLPVLSKALKSYGHTSLHYALRWRLLLFSEEHPVREVFVLWDAIFAAKDSVDAFFEDLMVAHLRQIKIGGDRGLVERIQKHRDWDCEELLWGAWEDFRARRSRAWRWYLVFVVVVLVLLQLLPYCFRQTQI